MRLTELGNKRKTMGRSALNSMCSSQILLQGGKQHHTACLWECCTSSTFTYHSLPVAAHGSRCSRLTHAGWVLMYMFQPTGWKRIKRHTH